MIVKVRAGDLELGRWTWVRKVVLVIGSKGDQDSVLVE